MFRSAASAYCAKPCVDFIFLGKNVMAEAESVPIFLRALQEEYRKKKKKKKHEKQKKRSRKETGEPKKETKRRKKERRDGASSASAPDEEADGSRRRRHHDRAAREDSQRSSTAEEERPGHVALPQSEDRSDGIEQQPRALAPSSSSSDVAESSAAARPPPSTSTASRRELLPPHRYVLAPMVGASELPFRLLCRKYGAQLAYTPMLSSHRLANDAAYRREHRVVEAAAAATGGGATGYDRPLTCHVWANTAEDFVAAAKRAAAWADAVDLNLGCPQRTAYVGHYGSYLTYAEEDRDLVCDMVSAAVGAVPGLPVTVKTRLLDSTRDTVAFCRRLAAAGASAIAVHARHRAGWERTGPGARDGPAHLDQVAAVREALVGGGGPVPAIIANGNTVTWEDVCDNLQSTGADGLMSAEGILDNPALFLPRYGSREERDKQIAVWDLKRRDSHPQQTSSEEDPKRQQKKKRKLLKKLNEIERIEEKLQLANEGSAAAFLSPEEKEKLSAKDKVLRKLIRLEAKMDSESAAVADAGTTADDVKMELRTVSLGSLYDVADDMLQLAMEYLELATAFPVKIRSVIFHVRRMLKTELVKYQLLDDCLSCESMEQVRAILVKMQHYRNNPDSFVYDREKAKQEKEALERKRREEGKRKAYEARMMRKANREGKEDLQYYLKIGAELPTATDISRFKKMPRDQVLVAWKERHSQHCLAFHLDADGCKRGRTCAFLHVEGSGRKSANTFEEKEEIAG